MAPRLGEVLLAHQPRARPGEPAEVPDDGRFGLREVERVDLALLVLADDHHVVHRDDPAVDEVEDRPCCPPRQMVVAELEEHVVHGAPHLYLCHSSSRSVRVIPLAGGAHDPAAAGVAASPRRDDSADRPLVGHVSSAHRRSGQVTQRSGGTVRRRVRPGSPRGWSVTKSSAGRVDGLGRARARTSGSRGGPARSPPARPPPRCPRRTTARPGTVPGGRIQLQRAQHDVGPARRPSAPNASATAAPRSPRASTRAGSAAVGDRPVRHPGVHQGRLGSAQPVRGVMEVVPQAGDRLLDDHGVAVPREARPPGIGMLLLPDVPRDADAGSRARPVGWRRGVPPAAVGPGRLLAPAGRRATPPAAG